MFDARACATGARPGRPAPRAGSPGAASRSTPTCSATPRSRSNVSLSLLDENQGSAEAAIAAVNQENKTQDACVIATAAYRRTGVTLDCQEPGSDVRHHAHRGAGHLHGERSRALAADRILHAGAARRRGRGGKHGRAGRAVAVAANKRPAPHSLRLSCPAKAGPATVGSRRAFVRRPPSRRAETTAPALVGVAELQQ